MILFSLCFVKLRQIKCGSHQVKPTSTCCIFWEIDVWYLNMLQLLQESRDTNQSLYIVSKVSSAIVFFFLPWLVLLLIYIYAIVHSWQNSLEMSWPFLTTCRHLLSWLKYFWTSLLPVNVTYCGFSESLPFVLFLTTRYTYYQMFFVSHRS